MSNFMKRTETDKAERKFVIIESTTEQMGIHAGQAQLGSPLQEKVLQPTKYSKSELEKRKIIYPGMKDSETLNAYRTLRVSLLEKIEKFNSSLLVSSVSHKGGASYTAINLGTSFTLDQQRNALLIDCNFERPSLAKSLDVKPEIGLNDYLSGREHTIQNMIYPTIVPRLRLIPWVVRENEEPIEFFTGHRMKLFLDEVKARYDDRIILIDAPPILESADTRILSELCDHVVLVLPYQRSSPKKIDDTIRAFGADKIAGMVMNN